MATTETTTNRTSGEFLSQYLEITGFNEENGAFMVCKEFLDNAVDACTKTNSISSRFPFLPDKEVELEVSVQGKYLSVICRDTGAGIDCDSVAALGEVFSSSKANDAKTGGEFGIGLKAVMLYSQRDLAEPLNVKIRMNEKEVWTFGMVLSGNSSAPEILNFSVQNISTEEWAWVTEFSLQISPLWDAQREAALEAYCAAYTLWREQQLIRIKLAFGTEKVFKSQEGQMIYSYGVERGEAKGRLLAAANACAAQELATVRIKAELRNKEDSENEENHKKEIILIRSCNGMPLLPNAASACLLTNSLRSFLAQFGPYFGIEEFTSDAQADDQTASDDNLERLAYRFCVQTAEEPVCWSRISLAIDIRSNKSLFCSFAKSHLQGETSLRGTVVSAFHSLFNQLQKKFPVGFRSIRDIARKKATEVFAPSIAASLAGIICSSQNREFQSSALNLLNLERLSVSGIANNEYASLNTLNSHASKRVKTKAAKEIIQDKVLEMLLEKLETADCSVQKKKKNKRRKSSPVSSPESPESFYSG